MMVTPGISTVYLYHIILMEYSNIISSIIQTIHSAVIHLFVMGYIHTSEVGAAQDPTKGIFKALNYLCIFFLTDQVHIKTKKKINTHQSVKFDSWYFDGL